MKISPVSQLHKDCTVGRIPLVLVLVLVTEVVAEQEQRVGVNLLLVVILSSLSLLEMTEEVEDHLEVEVILHQTESLNFLLEVVVEEAALLLLKK
jgi:hypothetical protein